MNIRTTILGLLMHGPQTGYELKRAFDSSLGFFAGASFGSIYPILGTCRREGLVKMDVEVQDGKPNRKIYAITDEGRQEFIAGLGNSLAMSPYRNEFLTRLFFFDFLPPDLRARIVEEYVGYVESKREALKTLEPMVNDEAGDFQKACYRFGVRYLEALAGNVKTLKEELLGAQGAVGPCCGAGQGSQDEGATAVEQGEKRVK